MNLYPWFDELELPGLSRPLDRISQRVGVRLYRWLAEGEPVPIERLAQDLGVDPEAVRQVLVGRPGVVMDAQGRVTAYLGLTLKPMPISIQLRGVRTWTWCAWDTMLVAQVLRRRVRVEAHCVVTRAPLRVDLGPTSVEDGPLRISMVTPSLEELAADFHTAFCARIHFLRDAAAGARWLADNPDGQVLDLPAAWNFAAHRNGVVFGDRP